MKSNNNNVIAVKYIVLFYNNGKVINEVKRYKDISFKEKGISETVYESGIYVNEYDKIELINYEFVTVKYYWIAIVFGLISLGGFTVFVFIIYSEVKKRKSSVKEISDNND